MPATAAKARFIRTYYQLWSLTYLTPATRKKRFSKMSIKRLFFLLEITTLKQSLGDEIRISEQNDHAAIYRLLERRKMIEVETLKTIVARYDSIRHDTVRARVHQCHRDTRVRTFAAPVYNYICYVMFAHRTDGLRWRVGNRYERSSGCSALCTSFLEEKDVWEDSDDDAT